MINEASHTSPGASPAGATASACSATATNGRNMNTFLEKPWLLVDDNEYLLTTLRALFEAITTAPIECHSSPQTALAAVATAPDKYELVITDYDMPGMDGMALCQALKAAAPQLKVILSTGSNFFTLKSAQSAGFDGLLNKPCRLSDIIAILYTVGLAKSSACAA